MVAHLDVVTSLAVNQHGLYLIYLSIYLSSMVAHLDAVTSLAVDQHGLYLISGSHDCSIRLTFVQFSFFRNIIISLYIN